MSGSDTLSKNEDKIEKGPRIGIRHHQTLLLFGLLTTSFAVRSCMSIALVAMTDKNASNNPDVPTYEDWSKDKGIILSAFFWSYIIPQIFAGYITKIYGTKWIIAGVMSINGISSALIPLFAEQFGSTGVIICRILQGLSQGFVFPCTHSLLGYWAPVNERAILSAIAYAGVTIGQIIAFPITGYIAASWVGWPVAFYFMSILGLSWVILWILFGYNNPSEHPSITIEEKNYIEKSLGHNEDIEETSTPWKGILTSVPFWALLTAEVGVSWMVSTFANETPSYLSHALDYDIESNGLLSMLPNVVSFFVGMFYAGLADFLVAKRQWPVAKVRKTLHAAGTVPSAIGLVILGFIPKENATLSVVVLVASLALLSAIIGGSNVNHMDLSPRFAGILMGITNSLSMITGIISPLLVQYVVTDMSDVTLWRIIFLVSMAITICSMVIFVAFGSGTVQWWNNGKISPSKDPDSYENTRTIPLRYSNAGYVNET